MIYKFKSKACGDVIMLGPNGDELLRLIGREPAAKGIIEPDAMAAARQRLQDALDQAEREARARGADDGTDDERRREAVGLRQRLWPMMQMLERAAKAREPIVWGV